MKRVVVAVLATSFILLPPASAVESKSNSVKSGKVSAVKCATTKAIGHTPPSVAPAEKVLRRIPRTFIFATNCGNIVVTTVGAKAPITVTQLATLARGGYFNDSLCHRLTTKGLYVLQCGDPTATGTGGPGYAIADELPSAGEYKLGSLAMANSGPNTNGSQFFIISGEQGMTLQPNYSLFGQVTTGLDTTVPALNNAGNDDPASNGVPPKEELRIIKVTITES